MCIRDRPDTRTKGTRRFDQFWKIFTQFEAEQQRLNGGAASVVLSVTLDDLADADASTLFQTNTGIELDPFDVVRLGTDGTADFVLTLDGLTGEPLHLGRSRRCASIGQRIAMLAIQGVCSWAGCTTSMSECEAHHILSWLRGGNTDITNLTGLCREHHRCNNDHRDGSFNKGYMEYDPSSGRSYLQRPGSGHRHFNTTDAASRSSWNRIRSRKQPPKCQCAPAPPPVHHPTPMRP